MVVYTLQEKVYSFAVASRIFLFILQVSSHIMKDFTSLIACVIKSPLKFCYFVWLLTLDFDYE